MNKMLLAPQWLIPVAVCVLLCTLLVGGSVWAQTATAPSAPAIESLTPSDQAITVWGRSYRQPDRVIGGIG